MRLSDHYISSNAFRPHATLSRMRSGIWEKLDWTQTSWTRTGGLYHDTSSDHINDILPNKAFETTLLIEFIHLIRVNKGINCQQMVHLYANKDLTYQSNELKKRRIEKTDIWIAKKSLQQDRRDNKYPFFSPSNLCLSKVPISGFKVASVDCWRWLRGCINARWLKMQIAHFCASPRSPPCVYYPPTVLVWYQRYLQFLPPPKANHINPLKDTCFIEACLFPLLRSLEVRLNVIKEWIHLTDWDYIHGKTAGEEPA